MKMYDNLSRGTEGDAARKASQKKREGVKLIFPISTSVCLPSSPFLLMTVFSFFLFFFNQSVLESGTRAYPTKPRLSVLLRRGGGRH